MTKEELISKYGWWGEHPANPIQDWKTEVEADETRLGYWEWVSGRLDEWE